MPDTRKRALSYFDEWIQRSGSISASKKYSAQESWTGRQAWWFDISIEKVEGCPEQISYLLCEKDEDVFHILQVPNRFFIDNMDKFETKYDNKIRLHLEAEDGNLFIDQRGHGKVDFSSFLMNK